MKTEYKNVLQTLHNFTQEIAAKLPYKDFEELRVKWNIVMEIAEQELKTTKTVVIIGDSDFRISVDKFDNLVINKYGGEDSSIYITPSVSNEIRIT